MNHSKYLDFSTVFNFQGRPYEIRLVVAQDLEVLRIWKNKNKQYFFHKLDISPKQQKAWFLNFEQDPLQQMFVCHGINGLVACVGFRQAYAMADDVELFNLICDDSELLGTGFVTRFFEAFIVAFKKKDVKRLHLKVLNSNHRAIKWYKKQGFQIFEQDLNCFLMEFYIDGGGV